MVFINAPFIMFNHVSLFDTCVKAATPRRPRHHQMCRNCQGVGLSVLSKHGDLSEKASKSVFKRKEDVCTACRTGTCLGRDSCHVLLGPHTVGNPNTDTCGDEDILQAQSGDDASTEPPHSDVWLAEAQSSSARLSALHSRSTQGPGPADSRMLQLLPRIVAWREDAPVATPSQSTTPRWSPVFALQLL